MTTVHTVEASGGDDVRSWFAARRDELTAGLVQHGAVLVTGLPSTGPDDLAAARAGLGLPAAVPAETFADRRMLGDGVVTAPDWPGSREMCLHHESSYARRPPRVLILTGTAAPDTGGATLLAGTAAVLRALPAPLVERFAGHGWLFVRTFRPYLGLPWQQAFGLADADALATYCAGEDITLERRADGTVHTRQIRPAVVRHPTTGEACWFNQVAFFSQWSVPETERAVLLATFDPAELPFNTFCGDGTPVTEAEFDAILAAYDAVTTRVPLRRGEVLLLDNVRTAHGREPYTGVREVAVALADPVTPVASVGDLRVTQLQP